jgi:ribonuclease P protein component
MLGRRHRFHGYNALRSVYERGRTVRSPHLGLRYGRRSTDRPYRVAVVVSRKVSKSAVIRNRLRRRIYAQVRLAEEVIMPGTDLIFTVFNDKLLTLDPAELNSLIIDLVSKANS